MDLSKLFEMQRELDERIVRDKGLEGQDLLPQKILALQVELGELAQNWRGFKFWSEDREPKKTKTVVCPDCKGMGKHYQPMTWDCRKCYGTGINTKENPLLEEYVDCLHFILSIGNYFGIKCEPSLTIVPNNVLEQLNDLFKIVSFLHNKYEDYGYCCGIRDFYEDLVGNFMNLGKLLGFTPEQIEQAYLEKNQVNHQRQEEGY